MLEQSENTKEEKCGIICEELNTSQHQAIVNSNEKIISVISGPPGTGKSFTIANIAAEKVSKGQSVLISSKNKEALAVIESKIGSQLGISNLCVNPSEDKNFTGLKAHLSHILGRKFIRKNIDFSAISVAFEEFQSLHDKHLVEEKKLIHQFENERTHHQRLKDTAKKELPASLKQRVYEFRSKDSIPLWEGLDQYYNSIEKIRSQAVASLKLVNDFRIEQGINEHRSTLRTYHSFLKARNQKRKEMLGAEINYSVILRSFPVWLIRANDVSRVLPFEKEVFDVLIIDEASQCDIPSLIPLMQRAKKVIIVGDIKQLNHISFISTAFEMGSKINVSDEEKYLCRHRDYSILHLAEEILDPMDKVELTEHFRSQFPIISFSNREFYKNNLEILTKRPISIAKHVEFVRTKGKRLKGVLRSEIGLILKEITRIIKEEETLPDNLKTSIGVLSPFRKQVDALFTELFQEFSLEIITAHKITVGTAFTFQGNERDLMLISFGLDKDALSGSFTFLNRDDVFNVSITRARNRQVFYYSFDPENLKWESTLGVFFRFYHEELKFDSGRETHDEFCKEVEKIFTTQNIKTWTNFQLSGLSIDLLIKTEHQFIGIDLIGFPGEMEDYYSLERYKMMQRGKINVFPLPFALWRGDPERCKQTLLSLINNFNPPPKHSLH